MDEKYRVLMLRQTKSRILCLLLVLLPLYSCSPGKQEAPISRVSPVTRYAPYEEDHKFALWIAEFKREAYAKGISQSVLRDAFSGVTQPLDSVLDRDRTQPEKTKSFDEYIEGFLRESKLAAADQQWQTHAGLLAKVQEIYGVPAPILLALWQTESSFGEIQGRFSIVESLATLAYDGRRSAFFRKELLNALVILQQERIPAQALVGSWAGAMGQVQFMPSSFLSFAIDFDGDGRRDIWNSDADAAASMANYLQNRGWNPGIGWGLRVSLPRNADAYAWVDAKEWRSFASWSKLGLRRANGASLPRDSYKTRLVMPGDDPSNAFLITKNYDVLMDWNRSTYFATGIGLLSDAIAARQ